MITLNKAIKTGNLTQIFTYKNPIEYGYKTHKNSYTNLVPKTDKISIAKIAACRAKNNLRRIVIGNMYHYQIYRPVFLTLTYHENMQSLEKGNYDFKKFIQRFDYKLGYKLRYVAVPEFQERGAVHYHLLIFNIPFTEKETIGKLWTHGFIKIKLVNKGMGVFNYIIKYLNKSFSDEQYKGKKRYFCSVSIRPEEIFDEEKVSELYQTLDARDLVSMWQYDVKYGGSDIICNTVKAAEYLTHQRNPSSLESEIPQALIIS